VCGIERRVPRTAIPICSDQMSLSPRTHIGTDEILTTIGAGGVSEMYRAHEDVSVT